MKIKEACIAAELSALKHQREVAVAVALAEAEVLEAAAENQSREGSRNHHDTVSVAIQHTCDYVEHHSQPHLSDAEPPVLTPYTPPLLPLIKPNVQADKEEPSPGLDSSASHFLPKDYVHATQQPELATPMVRQHATRDNDNHKSQQPERPTPAVHHHPLDHLHSAQSYSPSFNRASLQPNTDDRSGMSEIAKYLVHRELVNASLIKFNDRPENFWAWKSSFLNAIEGLNLTASEELDLLTKWLGN